MLYLVAKHAKQAQYYLLINCVAATATITVNKISIAKAKAVPLHAMEALGGRGGIAPTHSQPRH
jgi:hypothetical protein